MSSPMMQFFEQQVCQLTNLAFQHDARGVHPVCVCSAVDPKTNKLRAAVLLLTGDLLPEDLQLLQDLKARIDAREPAGAHRVETAKFSKYLPGAAERRAMDGKN